MKEFWGIPCPACGTAHGVQHLANGDVKSALASNPFSLLTVLLFPLFIFLTLNDIYHGKNTLGKFLKSIDHFFKNKPLYFWIGIVLVLTNWIWNIFKTLPKN